MTERRFYFWLTQRLDGKLNLIYGGETYEEAQQRGLELLGAQFGIKKLPTKNLQTASSFIRGNVLETTRDLRTATKRLSHKIKRRNKHNGDFL